MFLAVDVTGAHAARARGKASEFDAYLMVDHDTVCMDISAADDRHIPLIT